MKIDNNKNLDIALFKLALFFFLIVTLIESSFAFIPKQFEGELIQEIKSQRTNRVKKSNLAIKYKTPSNVYAKVTDGKKEVLYICNKKEVLTYTPAIVEDVKGQLLIQKNSKYCYSKLFDTFRKGFKDNSLYSVKDLGDNKVKFLFSKEAQGQLQVKATEFHFDGSKKFENLKSFEVTYVQNNTTKFLVKKLEEVKSLKDSDFTFTPPANTETIRQ